MPSLRALQANSTSVITAAPAPLCLSTQEGPCFSPPDNVALNDDSDGDSFEVTTGGILLFILLGFVICVVVLVIIYLCFRHRRGRRGTAFDDLCKKGKQVSKPITEEEEIISDLELGNNLQSQQNAKPPITINVKAAPQPDEQQDTAIAIESKEAEKENAQFEDMDNDLNKFLYGQMAMEQQNDPISSRSDNAGGDQVDSVIARDVQDTNNNVLQEDVATPMMSKSQQDNGIYEDEFYDETYTEVLEEDVLDKDGKIIVEEDPTLDQEYISQAVPADPSGHDKEEVVDESYEEIMEEEVLDRDGNIIVGYENPAIDQQYTPQATEAIPSGYPEEGVVETNPSIGTQGIVSPSIEEEVIDDGEEEMAAPSSAPVPAPAPAPRGPLVLDFPIGSFPVGGPPPPSPVLGAPAGPMAAPAPAPAPVPLPISASLGQPVLGSPGGGAPPSPVLGAPVGPVSAPAPSPIPLPINDTNSSNAVTNDELETPTAGTIPMTQQPQEAEHVHWKNPLTEEKEIPVVDDEEIPSFSYHEDDDYLEEEIIEEEYYDDEEIPFSYHEDDDYLEEEIIEEEVVDDDGDYYDEEIIEEEYY